MTTLFTPNTVSSDLLPTIVNLEEARERCASFASVLTAGPSFAEVRDFAHPHHKVVEFDDVSAPYAGYLAPTYPQVEEMIRWGAGRAHLLVHCHAGMSRSTATAWGIAIANGFDPAAALQLLKNNHPVETHYKRVGCERPIALRDSRPFIPNRLIILHLEQILGMRSGELSNMLDADQ
jgi:predicted protein tyrosine phosphatase